MTIVTARLGEDVALSAYRPKPAPKPRDARPCRLCGGNVRKSRMMRHDWICSKCERARGWK